MEEASLSLTVYFDGQFYVGLFEKMRRNKLFVSKYVFGAEPKDVEVFEMVNKRFADLKFSPSVEAVKRNVICKNPKAQQRKIKSMLETKTIGTKSQQAIKKQQEERATMRKAVAKERRELEKDEKFKLRQEKKKEKHKGN